MDRTDSQDMLSFGGTKTVGANMMIPERIVLSAGYDGDENREEETRRRFRDSTAFDETPLVLPEVVMGGMQTPPSILTIDHSEEYIHSRSDAGTPTHRPNMGQHSSGDGEADGAHTRYSRLHPSVDPVEDDDDDLGSGPLLDTRSNVIAGREDYDTFVSSSDLRETREINSILRRIKILETELDLQKVIRRRNRNSPSTLLYLNLMATVALSVYLYWYRR